MADLDDIFDADDDVNPSIDPVINALSDREISDELRLPDVLTSLSRREKLDLIVFKRSHNEIDWEEELLQRQEFIARKADMERLKRMTATDKKTKGKNKKSTTIEDSDDDLSDFAGMGTMDSDDSDDDLFDSDEEREILAKKAKKALSTNKTKSATKKSQLEDYDDDDFLDEAENIDDVDDNVMDIDGKVDTSEPAELLDYQKIQTRRVHIENWIKEPYFKEALQGTFVRLVVGSLDDPVTGEKVKIYRMCEIKDVTDNASKIPIMPGSKQYTTMRLTVAVGRKEKTRVKFHDVSNSRVKESEFAQYLAELDGSNDAKQLTTDEVKYLKNHRDNIVQNHKYSKDELTSMIQKKSGVSKAAHTTHEDALINLDYEIERAREENRLDDLDKIVRERDALLDKRSQLMAKMTRRNEANMNLNKKNYESRFAKDMNASKINKLKSQNTVSDDPFIRRQTNPENLWAASTRLQGKTISNNDASEKVSGSVAFEAVMNAQKKNSNNNSTNSTALDNLDMSIEAIRTRVRKRLGDDPIDVANIDSAARYLKRVCQNYPPKGSVEREVIRRGSSLTEYLASQ